MKKFNRFFRITLIFTLCAATLICAAGCGGEKTSALDPASPVTVTVWNYYNGDQLAAFTSLVEEFNSSVGIEKGIVVEAVSQGNIDTLADALIASVEGEAGAAEKPTLAAVYPETAYILDEADALTNIDKYFTADELNKVVPGFIDEGRFNAENELLLYPILKSTEVFTANETDWAPFAEATGITLEGLKYKEDLTAAAKAYYEWTDAQTPDTPDDGKSLYGRDSVANYIYIGSYQLGHEMFGVKNGVMTIDLDRDTFKTLWDNFYIPFINGYFGSFARFRSEDCKTGKILALTSSSSSASYLPTAVTLSDDTTYNISTFVSKSLPFKNAVNDAVVQQGASYCVLKSTEAQQEGACLFLKWFTEQERNLTFALKSGYSPVLLSSNTQDAIKGAYDGDTATEKGQNVLDALLISAYSFTNCEAYTTKPFKGSKEVRALLGDTLQMTSETDRAAVVEAIASGVSREEAVAKYITDEYFDAWFDNLCAQVAELTK